MNKYKWDKRFLNLAGQIATWSKDPSTKVGAVAVGSKGQILAQGYNGFPRGINDSADRLKHRQAKYLFVVHAEMNCIYNATYNGVSLDGATLYIQGLPCCAECAKGIIQVGVARVVTKGLDDSTPDRWLESNKITEELFAEAGVVYDYVV